MPSTASLQEELLVGSMQPPGGQGLPRAAWRGQLGWTRSGRCGCQGGGSTNSC